MHDKNVICLFEPSKNIFYSVRNEKKLSYYSILNHGNHGYNGSKNMMNKIKNEHDVLFLIDDSKYNSDFLQYMQELPDYVKDNAKLVKKFGNYEVYYKE